MDAAEAGQQNEEDEAASRQRNPSIEQLRQQCLAHKQQLKDAEEEYERYKALLGNQRQKAKTERAPLDASLARLQSKREASFQRSRDLEQHLEADMMQEWYSLTAVQTSCMLS